MSMKTRIFTKRTLGAALALALTGAALSGCVYYPSPYGGGYYAPPPVLLGGWWGWGGDHHEDDD